MTMLAAPIFTIYEYNKTILLIAWDEHFRVIYNVPFFVASEDV